MDDWYYYGTPIMAVPPVAEARLVHVRIALGDLIEVLEMPRGEPYGTYCHGVDAELIDELYP